MKTFYRCITQYMLTAQLRELEADGLIQRVVFAEVPPRVEYTMTEAAYAFKHVLIAVMAWAQEHGSLLLAQDRPQRVKPT